MRLLYFDHDHGTEVLLTIAIDRRALTVSFEYAKGPDPVHDEAEEVESCEVRATTRCASVEELDGFCRALADLLRTTSLTPQDPHERPFAPIAHADVDLSAFSEGLPPAQLACRVPTELVRVLRFEPAAFGMRPELRMLVES